jgi:hypothetical protein
MGEMSKLGWLIGLVKHAIYADSLYFFGTQLTRPKLLLLLRVYSLPRERLRSRCLATIGEDTQTTR